jgi:Carboxypeptidase regulatory-like domain/TonB dependent receptor
MRRLWAFLLAGAGLLAAAGGALAQGNTTGTVSGQVRSQDGAPLPGVTVNASSPALQGVRSTTTSANGDYIFAFLPAGDYEVAFELTGFQPVKHAARVALAQSVPLSVTMALANVSEEILVEAQAAGTDFAQTAPVASSYKSELVEKLPLNRGLEQTLTLAPGVNATGPARGSGATARGAITISGAMSFENLFTVNGVVVNENLRGMPLDLFIEDALQETTTTTGAVSAEFGRFSGGVVQAITKSGGNDFSGSFRTTFRNDDWRSTLPLNDRKVDRVVPVYESTLGGPIVKDKLWFFGAARLVDDTRNNQTFATLVNYDLQAKQRRYEGKLTYSLTRDHTLRASYLKIHEETVNDAFTPILDLDSLYGTRSDPQDLLSVNYTGVLSPKFFVEAQYSRRNLTFSGSGSQFTDLVKGTLLIDRSRGPNARYNAPTFCAVCGDPEQRDNDNVLVKATYFASTGSLGSHQVVGGVDRFDDARFADNFQSGSSYRIFGTSAILQGGDIFPVFANDGSTFVRWNPIFVGSEGAHFRTNSAFLNDVWRVNGRLTLNLGLRYDRNDGADSVGATVVKDAAFSPRVALTFDPGGDGSFTVNAGVAKYVAAIASSVADGASPGGRSAQLDYAYLGPAINTDPSRPLQTRAQAVTAFFDWFFANGGTRRPLFGSAGIPGVSTVIDDRLASPNTIEYTAGVTRRLGARGLVRLDGVYRDFRDFYSDRVDRTTGQVTVDVVTGRPAAVGQLIDVTVTENTNDLTRTYKGLNAQLSYRLAHRLNVAGNYTLSKTEGSADGETRASGPVTTTLSNYPEYRQASWNTPEGPLSLDRRHRARAWAIWDLPAPSALGTVSVSVLQSFDSGLPYEAVGQIDSRPYVRDPGYANEPARVSYFFTERGAFRTDDVHRTDLNLNWSRRLPGLGQRTELFFRATVLNAFDNRAVADNNDNRLNLTVFTNSNRGTLARFDPFTGTPVRGVNWELPENFGQPASRDAYQAPRQWSFSAGFRF